MDVEDNFRGFRFDRTRRTVPRRLIAIGLSLLAFTLAWNFVPVATLFLLMLSVVAILVWMASFGWRQTLISLHDLILRLERL